MTDGAGGPTVLRILLGTQLRRLRESRGVTAQEAARAIRGSESKISRIELGRNAVREVDIADLLTLYGISDPAEREQMLSLASQANQPGWWHRYQDILPSWFQAYIGLEESAESIRSYDAQFIPGLLQTEDYAAAVMALGEFAPEEAERLVYLRKERQRRFSSGGLRLWAVIDEVALRRRVGSPSVMSAQLDHLDENFDRPGFTLQVTPFSAGAHIVPGSFSILRFAAADLPDVVYLEQLTSAMYLDKRADVERYAAAMDKLSAISAAPDRSRQIIRTLLDDTEGTP
ncbi:MAG TPA: helix-turn-helix transcriptional regulator [Streptosporangiaceae bacterium]|nr:helix-turn-helix transcriptional regulator [Streptosporangiaceae bacterium]